jgi:spermidine synthase
MPRSRLAQVAPLLFTSGACSLIYETVWLRELRLVFGASTAASAATVACFVGGLGVGGLVFGGRADRSRHPLLMYATLEGGIAASSLVTPLLIYLVRTAYIAMGGTRALGSGAGTLARLVLAGLVFAVPTLLMGGTLPAVAKAVERTADEGRYDVALLYGLNTLGAVTGCMVSTFALFEIFGTRLTLLIACLINALVAVVARSLARGFPETRAAVPAETSLDSRGEGEAPEALTLLASAISGFVFCLMELVWYRMLGPLLGGSVFTFGLILAIALFGIGAGGIAYSLRPGRGPPTLHAFAWTCVLEAVCVAIPYALGDRVAVLTMLLHPLGDLSFGLRVMEWGLITTLVVGPTAFVTGLQFPLLIGLLRRGGHGVGRDVGLVYALNTAGAIVGSLAGGFGLLPLLTATGCWRLVGWLLLLLGGLSILIDARRRSPLRTVAPSLLAGLGALLLLAVGPTAAWRHSPIGAGRAPASQIKSASDVIRWEHERRGAIIWEADGRESSVALQQTQGLAFIVNGKNDGSVRGDADTAVMAGIVGAMLHPHPVSALVIGLGTGETAGWLAAIDSVRSVDVAELEPAILHVAAESRLANHDALANPKVKIELGDARELLLTSSRRYSVVMSEPSNPYRAGVASLFTDSYYAAIKEHLEDDGIFLQWLQGYEVDAETVRAVYATLGAVFPEVETWELEKDDLLLVASKRAIPHDIAQIRARMKEEPYLHACGDAWRATDAEAFFAHFVATSALSKKIAEEDAASVNTDDLNIVELGFARSVGETSHSFGVNDIRRVARRRGEGRPLLSGDLDWPRVDEARAAWAVSEAKPLEDYVAPTPEGEHRAAAWYAFGQGDSRRGVLEWRLQPEEPRGPTEQALLGMALADIGDEDAVKYARLLASFDPAESDALLAHFYLQTGKIELAVSSLEALFVRLRVNPWPLPLLVKQALEDAGDIGTKHPRYAARLYDALRQPFAVRIFEDLRRTVAFATAQRTGGPECVAAEAVFEPNVPWTLDFLQARTQCLERNVPQGDSRRVAAERELRQFLSAEPPEFAAGL